MNILLFLLLLSSITVCGQSSGEKIHAHIDNTKTLAHIRIPGTRLYIIPPPHFTVATSIVGLKKGEQAAMQIFDLVGGNFYTNAATFSKFEFLSRGAKVSDYNNPPLYLYIIGTIHKNVETTLQEVKKLAYSIKLK